MTAASSGAVVIAADNPMLAARVEAALRRLPGWCVYVSQPSRLREVAAEHPEAVIVLALGGVERRRALRAIRGWPRRPAVIVLADDGADVWTPAARALGVRAVLPSSGATPEELVEAVRAVHAGLLVLHPDALVRARAGETAAAPGAPLTSREREILEMLADGASNRLIASRLGISRHTAKFHVASILTKLGVRSRTEAVATALRSGLLTL
jgi:DNA-binding NarL/FixJ family response regulator